MRRFLVVFVVAITFEGMARGQNQPVYKLPGKVIYLAGFWNNKYLTTPSWCMQDPGKKKVKVEVILMNEGLMLKPADSTSGCCVYILYDDIVGLSRGNIGTPAVGPIVTTATGLGSLLAGVLKSTVTKTQAGKATTSITGPWLGATVGLAGAAILFGVLSYRHAKNANYIAISYNENHNSKNRQSCQAENDPPASADLPEGASSTPPQSPARVLYKGDIVIFPNGRQNPTPQPPKPAAQLFYKGNLVILLVTDRNAYWDTSMILSSATGCEFVSEEAEKK